MKMKMLAVAAMSVIVLPSCMHPVDRVLRDRAASRAAEQLEAVGRVSQGACDDVGKYAAKNCHGLSMDMTAVADISE
jgi:hypothetical protein